MLFVPAGEFTKGRDVEESVKQCQSLDIPLKDELCNRDIFNLDGPAKKMPLDSYLIDKYEVTRGQFFECVKDKGCNQIPPFSANPVDPDFPVTDVSYFEAEKYCEWAGKKLPTEAQWEKAARGTDDRIFPWGDEFTCEYVTAFFCPLTNDTDATFGRKVGSLPKNVSPYGVFDMAGNVNEWTRDRFKERGWANKGKLESSFLSNKFGQFAIIKGGGWGCAPSRCSITNRAISHRIKSRNKTVGFRCVYEP